MLILKKKIRNRPAGKIIESKLFKIKWIFFLSFTIEKRLHRCGVGGRGKPIDGIDE